MKRIGLIILMMGVGFSLFAQSGKLSEDKRKEFEALEEEIPALEAEKAELETAMSSGTLSTDELMAKSQRITQVMEEIDEKTMRWLELSELA